MKIKIIAVGKLKENYLKAAEDEYYKKINKICQLEIIEVLDEKAPENLSISQEIEVKKSEGERILNYIKPYSYIIALAIDGKQKTTIEMKTTLNKLKSERINEVVFIIGGSLGLSEEVLKKANEKLSFSQMTFPHQLMRIILLEQIEKWIK